MINKILQLNIHIVIIVYRDSDGKEAEAKQKDDKSPQNQGPLDNKDDDDGKY